jgi:hypothetical protein
MQINRVSDLSPDILKARVLWEDNMREPWDNYALADKFVVVHDGEIVGGFAVYWDESDGIAGHYCSDTQGPAEGGVSVFEGYGAGGTSYFDSPLVTDGGAGYVKIMVPEE